MPVVSLHFLYSKCTGGRRALCIGINYRDQRHGLRGCINDAKYIFNVLIRASWLIHSPQATKRRVTDHSPHPRSQPPRQNIIDAMQWLVHDAHPNDALFFHYSGHGGQTGDLDGDEGDGYDEGALRVAVTPCCPHSHPRLYPVD
ncbi:caspase domain-containing protein [Mycena epipterygia]|nr:caspase domain-containing protein [Mycena epipterygia]